MACQECPPFYQKNAFKAFPHGGKFQRIFFGLIIREPSRGTGRHPKREQCWESVEPSTRKDMQAQENWEID
jgi:hypothetical protein